MKIARTILIALYAIAFMIIGSLICRLLFESGGGRSRGFGYGNLWIQYSVEERGVLSPLIPWLIATPEMPSNQSYRGDEDQWTFVFANGKTFTFRPDSKHLIWIDPTAGPTMFPIEMSDDLVLRIEQRREQAQVRTFESGSDLLDWLANPNAEQADTGQPATRSQSTSEGGGKP